VLTVRNTHPAFVLGARVGQVFKLGDVVTAKTAACSGMLAQVKATSANHNLTDSTFSTYFDLWLTY
jgi:hypothetical protein